MNSNKEMTDHDFDKLIKQKFDNFEADVPDMCWEAIERALPPMANTPRFVLWRRLSVAAVVLLAVSLSGYLFLKKEKKSRKFG